MRIAVAIIAVGVILAGCQAPPDTSKTEEPGQSTQEESGVGVMSPAAGGASPVTGSESVGGAGMGGVGRAAKDKAREVAGQASQSATTTDEATQ